MKGYCYANPDTTEVVILKSGVFELSPIEEIENPKDIFLAINPNKTLEETLKDVSSSGIFSFTYEENLNPSNLIIIPIEIGEDNKVYLL
jgi:hypothetical protein